MAENCLQDFGLLPCEALSRKPNVFTAWRLRLYSNLGLCPSAMIIFSQTLDHLNAD